MDEKKRARQSGPAGDAQDSRTPEQPNEAETRGNEQDENPQSGGSWNNYQTREMSGSEEGGEESFYRNRERGNMDERSDDSGGSLY